MYLKQIKTAGFKSFADKITIDFEKGITGVVGPNGSGKSNIVDAVRWVLGEQSVKSLRGSSSMTDVIFSGSKSRNPASSASVTLIFDNSDKYFGIDYTEIAIKRVVYKTGENEYYLNGERCRLKDIINLVIDTGIAKESFNIITQGNIQEILSNKPEDRRVIFEEAAGVLKYKKRKDEAIRKLDRTHDNIERVRDIINELEGQVIPLKEQSEKAKRYVSAKDELEQVEVALIVHDIETINNDYQFAKEQIDSLNEGILSLNENYNSDQANLEKEKLNYTKDNQLLYETQQQLIDVTGQVEKIGGQKALISERKKYKGDNNILHDNALILKEQQLKVKNDIDSVESDLETKSNNMADLQASLSQIETKETQYNQRKSDINEQINAKIRRKTELTHKIDVLEQSIDNNNRLSYATRSVLNNPKLRGIHNVIGDLVEVLEKYVTAIDIALGASSQFIVVDNEIKAKEAVNYLKSNNLGRATFFPLNIIKERQIDLTTYNQIKNHPSFIDIASNIVSYNQKYQNIILNQLGNVIVTNDIDGANEIGKIINHRYKIVTLDGELLHVGGSITGGKIRKTTSVLNERQELQQAKNEMRKVENDYKELQLKLNDVDGLLKEVKIKKYNFQTEMVSLNQVIIDKTETVTEYKQKLDNINDELKGIDGVLNESLDEVQKEVIDKYYELTKEREKINQKIKILTEKITTTRETIAEIEAAIKVSSSSLSKKQQVVNNLEIEANRYDVKLDNLLIRLSEEYTLTFEKAKKDNILLLEVEEARKKVEHLKNTLKNLGDVNTGAIEEYERLNSRCEFLNEQKNDLFKAENILLSIIKEMDLIMKELFEETFVVIKKQFNEVFKKLFGGGSADLKLTDPNNMLETGVEIKALPPGKKLQHISLLSGGEKALTAIALLFAILKVKPVPFCLLDEIEAALDEPNVGRFTSFLREFKEKTQFIIITHKKKTMEDVDVLYGITMQESGVSKLVSVKLEDINV